ncbi:MAG: trigger factor [Candidatus Moranbacteria bacterium RIFCSPHIGHO2_01_FULL_55_24]|nr:MAG: trigger factor [Candidatus Moranbacteria bacterium RIFCSPHIGHO2_01_FULL_55_24]
MEVKVKNLPESRVELEISLPWEEWKGEMDHAAESLAKQVKMEGFRPGKAPRAVLEQRFGRGALLAEAAEHAVSHSYPKALEEKALDAIGRPEVELGTVKEEETLTYTIRTDVMPEAKLSDWKSAVKKINKEAGKEPVAVSDQDVADELARIAEMRAPIITVPRKALDGDTVLVDFTVRQDGVVIEGGKSENHPLVLGSNAFIPGFEGEVAGMEAGEEKIFTLTFPADYHVKHLAGKPAEFTVKVRAVQEKQIPEINDEFAKMVGNFESLAKLEENIRSGMAEEQKTKRKEEQRTKILDVLIDGATIEFPRSLIEEELGRMLREFESQVQMMGMDFQGYLNQVGKSEEDVKKDWEPQAKKRLAAHLVLDAVAKELEISIESDEIEAEMNKTIQYYKNVKDIEKNIDLSRLYTAVRGQIQNERAIAELEKIS